VFAKTLAVILEKQINLV